MASMSAFHVCFRDYTVFLLRRCDVSYMFRSMTLLERNSCRVKKCDNGYLIIMSDVLTWLCYDNFLKNSTFFTEPVGARQRK